LYKKSLLNKAHVFSRDATILAEFVGLDIAVHNGMSFYPLSITPEMVGFKFGEFVFTKKTGSAIHKNQLKKLEKKSRK
jgi:small subunit ribosomal protein S19